MDRHLTYGAVMRLPPRQAPGMPTAPSPGPVSRAVAAQRGQTAVEYIGLILGVVAIISAIAFSGIGATLTQRIEEAICSITDKASLQAALGGRGDLITENLQLGLGFSVSDHVDVDGFLLDSGFQGLEAGGELHPAAGGLQDAPLDILRPGTGASGPRRA